MDRIEKVKAGFAREFGRAEGRELIVCSAPGRTEIGGNHTDHQRGRVLTAAVNLDAIACAAPNGTDVVRVYSEGYGLATVDMSVREPIPEEYGSTEAIIRGVMAGVSRGMGFDAYVISDVPGGSGLSSSACFEVLIGTIANELFCGGALEPVEIARIGQYAENEYFGKPSGLLDQMGCAMGGAVYIDFAECDEDGLPKYERIDFDLASYGYAMCIIDSGSDHADLTDDYAAVPEEMKAVAAAFGRETLSEVKEEEFYERVSEFRETVGDRAIMRAMHFFAETKRAKEQAESLKNGDFDRFLELVRASGKSSYELLQNVDTYRNPNRQPVAFVLALAEHYLGGRGAVRVHGGGFAGAVQAYVPLNMLDDFKREMDAVLGEGACVEISIRPVGGCRLAEEQADAAICCMKL